MKKIKSVNFKMESKKNKIAKSAKIKYDTIKYGKNITISEGVKLSGKKIILNDGVSIGPNTSIKARNIEIGRDSKISGNSEIFVIENFTLGKRSDLCNCNIKGRNVKIGDDFFSSTRKGELLIIGGGNCFYPKSNLTVGNRCTIHDVYINIAMPVEIGNDVGISPGTTLITHYFWDSIFEGYPQNFAGIIISDGSIIGADSSFLPGTKIGKNCIVGARSVVTKDFPASCLIAGNPAKIIKKSNRKKMSQKQRNELLKSTMSWYKEILKTKGFAINEFPNDPLKFNVAKDGISATIFHSHKVKEIQKFKRVIVLTFNKLQLSSKNHTIINLSEKTISGLEDELTDDLRDFLRKVGIRIFTKRRFCSISPTINF